MDSNCAWQSAACTTGGTSVLFRKRHEVVQKARGTICGAGGTYVASSGFAPLLPIQFCSVRTMPPKPSMSVPLQSSSWILWSDDTSSSPSSPAILTPRSMAWMFPSTAAARQSLRMFVGSNSCSSARARRRAPMESPSILLEATASARSSRRANALRVRGRPATPGGKGVLGPQHVAHDVAGKREVEL
jgi:hypothetical protein